MIDELKKYLRETPLEQLLDEWESIKTPAGSNSPTMAELKADWDVRYSDNPIVEEPTVTYYQSVTVKNINPIDLIGLDKYKQFITHSEHCLGC
jgi:hypothetical protein